MVSSSPIYRGSDPVGLPHTMDGLVDDLDMVLDALHVRGPVHIISHSFGGAVATEYSLRHPQRLLGLMLLRSIAEGARRTNTLHHTTLHTPAHEGSRSAI